jgi:hypothetical protein
MTVSIASEADLSAVSNRVSIDKQADGSLSVSVGASAPSGSAKPAAATPAKEEPERGRQPRRSNAADGHSGVVKPAAVRRSPSQRSVRKLPSGDRCYLSVTATDDATAAVSALDARTGALASVVVPIASGSDVAAVLSRAQLEQGPDGSLQLSVDGVVARSVAARSAAPAGTAAAAAPAAAHSRHDAAEPPSLASQKRSRSLRSVRVLSSGDRCYVSVAPDERGAVVSVVDARTGKATTVVQAGVTEADLPDVAARVRVVRTSEGGLDVLVAPSAAAGRVASLGANVRGVYVLLRGELDAAGATLSVTALDVRSNCVSAPLGVPVPALRVTGGAATVSSMLAAAAHQLRIVSAPSAATLVLRFEP